MSATVTTNDGSSTSVAATSTPRPTTSARYDVQRRDGACDHGEADIEPAAG
jgi:hypothetical protein